MKIQHRTMQFLLRGGGDRTTYHCQVTYENFRAMAMKGQRFSRFHVGDMAAWSAVEGYLAGLPDAGARIRFLRQELRAVAGQITASGGDSSTARGERHILGLYQGRLREQLNALGATEHAGADQARLDVAVVETETTSP